MSEFRYERQSRVPDWDQEKLRNSTVAVVGAGALGNHVCIGLIGLGIGTIKIFDYDQIKPHNLNRQSLFCENDIGLNKAEALANRLIERDSSSLILGIQEKITENNIEEIIRNVDLIIDCVDTIFVRKILNRYCLINNISLIHGGISWFGGQAGIITRETPCINCIYPDDIQKAELETINSCVDKPEPSIVYISQIIAGLMVQNIRRALMPLSIDKNIKNSIYKLDFRLTQPFYISHIIRKVNCECIDILKKVAPDIIQREFKENQKRIKDEKKEILNVIKKLKK